MCLRSARRSKCRELFRAYDPIGLCIQQVTAVFAVPRQADHGARAGPLTGGKIARIGAQNAQQACVLNPRLGEGLE